MKQNLQRKKICSANWYDGAMYTYFIDDKSKYFA